MIELLNLLEKLNHLKQLPRTGWLFAGIRQPESVAEHSYVTALLSMLLAEVINADWAAEGLDGPLDMGKLLAIALLHDLAESVLTDLPKRSTDLIGQGVKHAAEARAMKRLMAGIPNGTRHEALWQEYGAAATPEARLVRDADKLEMVHQALCYELGGQRNLQDFWQGHRWHYVASRQLFEQLCASRPSL